eukprot:6663277-Alexandrium_andersonii.AAC.1
MTPSISLPEFAPLFWIGACMLSSSVPGTSGTALAGRPRSPTSNGPRAKSEPGRRMHSCP